MVVSANWLPMFSRRPATDSKVRRIHFGLGMDIRFAICGSKDYTTGKVVKDEQGVTDANFITHP